LDYSLQRVSVSFEYPVCFTEGAFEPDNPRLREALSYKEPDRCHRALVVLDRGVADGWPTWKDEIAAYFDHHGRSIRLAASPLLVDGGEAVKNDERVLRELIHRVHELGIDRHSFVVAIGGGAVLDTVGYAVAVAHRGLRLVRLPTTVLSQADSGVGVKNGINAFGKKNFLGTFCPPFAVVNDRRFLSTLSRRDTIAGMAEGVKVALVRDAALFDWIGRHAALLHAGEPHAVFELVRKSARLHLQHIATSGDPFELGSARPLDFGHWAAHKLESLTAHRLRHGEAVAIGLALDTVYSAWSGLCSDDVPARVLDVLERLGFRLWDDALDARDEAGRPNVLAGLDEFREHLGGELTLTMLRQPGEALEVHEMREAGVLAAIDRLRQRAAR